LCVFLLSIILLNIISSSLVSSRVRVKVAIDSDETPKSISDPSPDSVFPWENLSEHPYELLSEPSLLPEGTPIEFTKAGMWSSNSTNHPDSLDKATATVVPHTPYDNQMSSLRDIIYQRPTHDSCMSRSQLDRYMSPLRYIPYQFYPEWHSPEQTRSLNRGDCKAKAVDLLNYMRHNGCDHVVLVIGYRTRGSKMSHAWLEWTDTENHEWLLDATFFPNAVPFNRVRADEYREIYAYQANPETKYKYPDYK